MKVNVGAALLLIGGPIIGLAQTPAPKPQGVVAPAPGMAQPANSPLIPLPAPAAAPMPAVDPSKVVMTVGTEKITAGEFERLTNAVPQLKAGLASPQGRRQIADSLASMKVLAQQARAKNLQNNPQVQLQIENTLAGAAYQDLTANLKTDDASLRKYYADHKGEYEEAKGRHILIRFQGSPVPVRTGQKDLTKEEALAKTNAIRKRLLAGEDFAKIAKEESDDTGSGAQGGDLGTFRHGMMVAPFEKVAFSLPAGQLSEPVETQFGYHLIKVDERKAQTFEEVKPEIEGKMKPEMAQKALEALKAQTPITIDEAYFGPPGPKMPAGN